MPNIVLVGFMGTGKTSVGKRLARELKMGFLEMDETIEKEAGIKISEIFARFGEKAFRKKEKELVKRIAELDNLVISTGGGVILEEENVKDLKKNGILICLWATPSVIYNRIKNEAHRPLINCKNPKKRIKELLEDRASFYAQADYTIDNSRLTLTGAVKEIIKILPNLAPL